MSVAEKIAIYHSTLKPSGATLVAVSKFQPVGLLREAYDAGQRIFGESRVDELLKKRDALPSDIQWHFIGHLQSNKVRRLVGATALIESVDSERLLSLLDAESERKGVVSRVLLQVHVAREETKTGFAPDELIQYFRARRFESLRATHLCGLMAMASNAPGDMARIRADFNSVANLHRQILDICPDLRGFETLSMGMSGDYRIALGCGSNMVRIGSDIFGSR